MREIDADVRALARRIGASPDDLPTYGVSRDFGYPHVEVEHGFYHYVVVERGQEVSRRFTDDYDELLYWILRDATRILAFRFELHHRIEDQDCR
ncbi:MAG TPA: Imm63 family immunity protein, partial [Bradyrhizobium sp.]|nr:Imm63 family immunity protein [Bradyrhizobium sp.]